MKYVWIALAGAALVLPPLLDYHAFSLLDASFAVRLCGMTGFTLMSLQFLLASRLPFLVRPFGQSRLMKVHRKTGAAAWIFLLCHGLGYLVLKTVWEGELRLTLSYEWPLVIGLTGLFLLSIIAATALYRKTLHLPYKTWKKIHRTAYFIYPPLFVHALLLGSTIQSAPAVKAQWVGIFAFVLCGWGWRAGSYLKSRETEPSQ